MGLFIIFVFMVHKLQGIFILLFVCSFVQAQTTFGDVKTDEPTVTKLPDITKSPNELIITPTIGLGAGVFSFYGDLYRKKFQAPMVSRVAYDLSVSQPVTDYLQLNFYVLFGKLGANERLVQNNRNLNFESQIRAGGVNLQYNFDHLLPAKRMATPYVSVGIESFEFLSKTDLKDKDGNLYYYWSDGSTRNKDENALDASTAIELYRDYTYESDIREMNLDGFGKYAERSFAVPVGAGAMFKLNDYFNFKIGATMHFSFTDYIDGVTDESIGNRKGNSRNDNFMLTSFALQYNLATAGKKRAKKQKAKDMEQHYENIDFLALENDDYDKDGVIDFKDLCGGTPIGVPVDENGCPFDDDGDGVANYMDDELKSRKKAIVNMRGVELTDSLIAEWYKRYMDETGLYASVENFDLEELRAEQKVYMVKLGSFKKGLPPELMTKFLSIGDIASASDNSETIYTAGEFNSFDAAEARKRELEKEGLTAMSIVYRQNGQYYDASSDYVANNTTKNNTSTANNTAKTGVIEGYFVGEDNKTPLANSKINVVNEQGEVIQTGTTDELGAFHFEFLPSDQYVLIQLDEADPQLKRLKKVFLTSSDKSKKPREVYPTKISHNLARDPDVLASNTNVNTNKNNSTTNTNTTTSTFAGSKTAPGVVLRVQLGAYSKPISKNVYKGINDLIEIKTAEGMYKYMVGSYTSFDAAARRKVEMLTKGYPDAFIAAYKDGKRISLAEAGAEFETNDKPQETPENATGSGANKNLVKFKVQVGVYQFEPPDDKMVAYSKLKGLTNEKTKSGLTKYVAGNFKTYAEAQAYKSEVSSKYGLTDAFVVAVFDNEYISIQEALELLK